MKRLATAALLSTCLAGTAVADHMSDQPHMSEDTIIMSAQDMSSDAWVMALMAFILFSIAFGSGALSYTTSS